MRKVAFLGSRNVPIPPVRGGAIELWIDQVTRRLRETEALVISPADPALPESETLGTVRYQRFRESRIYMKIADTLRWDPFSYARRGAACIRDFDPDVIHLMNVPKAVPVMRELVPRARIVLHCMNTWEQIGRRSRPPRGTVVAPDIFIGCSRFLVDAEREGLGRGARDYGVLTNGADTAVYRPWWDSPAREARRKQMDLDGRRVILFCGRLNPNKGIHILLDAMPSILSRMPDAVLLILGSKGFGFGNTERNDYEDRLRRAAEPLGGAVRFGGFIAPGEIHEYYAAADVFCHPARWQEPFAFVVCEAGAAGLPVVASASGGTPELVVAGETGELVPPDCDGEALAGAIAGVLSDTGRARRLGETLRARVLREHSWDAIAAATDALYARLCA